MLEQYQKVVVWVGAGLSQASGVPSPPNYDRLTFLQDPERAWQAYRDWQSQLRECQPNPGHQALQRAQQNHRQLRIVTLNQDGLLQRGGCEALELHGSVWGESRCFHCDLALCSCATALRRPDLIWPGEDLPATRVDQALQWLAECDCLVSVGTSGRLPPSGQFPLQTRQAYRLEINLEETPMSPHHDECWRGPAEELLARLWQ